MHPHLVGAAGVKLCFYPAEGLIAVEHPVVGERGLAAPADDGHFALLPRVRTDGQRNAAGVVGQAAVDQRQVVLAGGALLKLQAERAVCLFRAGKTDDTAGFAVEAVYRPDAAISCCQLLLQARYVGLMAVGNRQQARRLGHE